METKSNKILCKIKTQWIFMLSLAKIVMVEYRTLWVKMAMDKNTNQQIKFNYMNTYVTNRFYLGLHAFCPCQNQCMFLSSLPKCRTYLYVTLWQPSKFVKVIFITCTMIRPRNLLHTTFGLSSFLLDCKHEGIHMRCVATLTLCLHDPFRHLKHKLWPKEGPGVKLTV